jgi:hypothetical protein
MKSSNSINKKIRNDDQVSKSVARKIHRDRVLQFEKEIQERLRKLAVIESGMNEISMQRKEWLENISQNHHESSNTFQQHVRLFQLQSEHIAWKFKLSSLSLDEEYENHLLDLLIDYTQPLHDNETEEIRNQQIQIKSREKTTQMKYALQTALDERIDMNGQLYGLQMQYSELKVASDLQQKQQYEELKHHLNEYLHNMHEQKMSLRKVSHEVMKDYLILRHNAQVIQEILNHNQNQANAIRFELQKVLDSIVVEAKEQRSKLERLSHEELVALTNDLRHEITMKESIIETLTKRIATLKTQKTQTTYTLFQEIMSYQKQYNDLQSKRYHDVKMITQELTFLKQQIYHLECQLYTPGYTPQNNDHGHESGEEDPIKAIHLMKRRNYKPRSIEHVGNQNEEEDPNTSKESPVSSPERVELSIKKKIQPSENVINVQTPRGRTMKNGSKQKKNKKLDAQRSASRSLSAGRSSVTGTAMTYRTRSTSAGSRSKRISPSHSPSSNRRSGSNSPTRMAQRKVITKRREVVDDLAQKSQELFEKIATSLTI